MQVREWPAQRILEILKAIGHDARRAARRAGHRAHASTYPRLTGTGGVDLEDLDPYLALHTRVWLWALGETGGVVSNMLGMRPAPKPKPKTRSSVFFLIIAISSSFGVDAAAIARLLGKVAVKSWVALLHLMLTKYTQRSSTLLERAVNLADSDQSSVIHIRNFALPRQAIPLVLERARRDKRVENGVFRPGVFMRYADRVRTYVGRAGTTSSARKRAARDLGTGKRLALAEESGAASYITYIYSWAVRALVSNGKHSLVRHPAERQSAELPCATFQVGKDVSEDDDDLKPVTGPDVRNFMQHREASIAFTASLNPTDQSCLEKLMIFAFGTVNSAPWERIPLRLPKSMTLTSNAANLHIRGPR